MAYKEPKIRHDQYTNFHNPAPFDFIGRWDGEDYIITAGSTEIFPAWLAKHFAKRLCDEVMNKEHGVPLRHGDPLRDEFIAKCIDKDLTELAKPEVKTLSTKEQIQQNQTKIRKSEDKRKRQEAAAIEKRELEEGTTEEDRAAELARENRLAGEGKANLAPNPTGRGDKDARFEGTVEGASVNLKDRIDKTNQPV